MFISVSVLSNVNAKAFPYMTSSSYSRSYVMCSKNVKGECTYHVKIKDSMPKNFPDTCGKDCGNLIVEVGV